MATSRSTKKPEYPEISASVAGGKGHCLKKKILHKGQLYQVFFFCSGKNETWKDGGGQVSQSHAQDVIKAAIQSLRGEQGKYSFPLVFQQLLGLD